jgi:hypothetical protein
MKHEMIMYVNRSQSYKILGFKQFNYSVNRRYFYKYISNKSLGNYGWFIAETAHHSEAPEFTPGYTDIVISVVYDENTTVSLYFRNVTCNEEGIYRIEVQDDTFNGLDIMGTLSIKGKYLHSRNVLEIFLISI